jgi:hypothetical protein
MSPKKENFLHHYRKLVQIRGAVKVLALNAQMYRWETLSAWKYIDLR